MFESRLIIRELIEVNPRHVRYYERSYGFQALTDARHNDRVNAPAVLLCADLAAIRQSPIGVASRLASEAPTGHSLATLAARRGAPRVHRVGNLYNAT